MIDRCEIIDIATQVSLTPHVVEKDYVLGWFLAGISNPPELQESWIFKGGHVSRNVFSRHIDFPKTFDFTLLNAAHIDDAFAPEVRTVSPAVEGP
jgi:predicted nucleotidyltransferase component of viral defense system